MDREGKMEISLAVIAIILAMYNLRLAFAIAAVALFGIGVYHWGKTGGAMPGENAVNNEREAIKEAHLERVRALARQKGDVTNNEVEEALGVSNATAARYLHELESRGDLERAGGETGRGVSYTAH